RIGGSITLDGGILRAASFSESNSLGTIEINGSGLLQFNNAMESVSAVESLITSGFFTTSAASPLVVEVVDVGGIDFTQIWLGAALGLPGDYNENDEIDAADYTVWRDTMTAGGTVLANDPTPGTVNESDFEYWRDHFGEVLGSGSGALASSAVPEPASFVLGLMALAAAGLLRRAA
ncbi:MAG TPA: PEP-CTERM sorting domain-containing protein, partial [Mycobacterium sp.]